MDGGCKEGEQGHQGSESEGRTDSGQWPEDITDVLVMTAWEQMFSYWKRLLPSDGGGGKSRGRQRERGRDGALGSGIKAGSPGPAPSESPRCLLGCCLGTWLLALLGGLSWYLLSPRACRWQRACGGRCPCEPRKRRGLCLPLLGAGPEAQGGPRARLASHPCLPALCLPEGVKRGPA